MLPDECFVCKERTYTQRDGRCFTCYRAKTLDDLARMDPKLGLEMAISEDWQPVLEKWVAEKFCNIDAAPTSREFLSLFRRFIRLQKEDPREQVMEQAS